MGSLWAVIFFISALTHWLSGEAELMYLSFIAMSVNLTDVNLDLLRERISEKL